MDNVQNCDSYINIPSSQTISHYLLYIFLILLASADECGVSLILIPDKGPNVMQINTCSVVT
jgi:hypothetical protein